MRGQRYCYSHQRKHEQGARKSAGRVRQSWFESVPLDDVVSVQRALRQVIERLLSRQIDHKLAGQILYKLQTASVEIRDTPVCQPGSTGPPSRSLRLRSELEDSWWVA
jgi:hypothetical protein